MRLASGSNECFVKIYSSIANVVSVSHIYVNSFWYMAVACFTPKASVSLVSEVGYVKPDTFVQDKMGAFTVIAEEMALRTLLWLLWCGSSYHMLVCGNHFSSVL